MLRSMTGFATYNETFNNVNISFEIKSVNHRYLDITFKLPKIFNMWENLFKEKIAKTIKRGKLTFYLNIEKSGNLFTSVAVDEELANYYLEALKKLQKRLKLPLEITLKDFINFRGVFELKDSEPDEKFKNFLLEGLEKTLNRLIIMKNDEGAFLEKDIYSRIDRITTLLKEIGELKDKVLENYKEKLYNLIEIHGLKDNIDEKRIEFEIVLMADKSDITEEIVRLKSHIEKFKKTCEEAPPVGKKLDFILQEMNRETNTIGAKASLKEITNIVIDIKDEIEKIREQIQNIE